MALKKAAEPQDARRGRETVGLARALAEAGASPEWAEPWRYADLGVDGVELRDLALTWLATGMAAKAAIEWSLDGDWLPEVAVEWAEDGWTPREVGFLHDRIFYADVESPGQTIDTLALDSAIDWAESGLPHAWILLCVAAGEFDIAQSQRMYEAAQGTWRIEWGLHVMANARGADVKRLRMNRRGRVA